MTSLRKIKRRAAGRIVQTPFSRFARLARSAIRKALRPSPFAVAIYAGPAPASGCLPTAAPLATIALPSDWFDRPRAPGGFRIYDGEAPT